MLLAACSLPARAQTITVASVGGVLQDAEWKALYAPTAKALGINITVQAVQSPARIAGIRQQVRANAPGWDIVELFGGICEQLSRQGLTTPLDYAVIDRSGIPERMIGKDWIGVVTYSTILAYSSKVYGDNGPKSWAEFWDVKKFPGRRSMQPRGATLEAAMLSTGVPADQLYPINLDVAFKQLELIRPHMSVWSASPSHSEQLVSSGEVDTLLIQHERVEHAQDDGAPYRFSFQDGFIGFDCLLVPKSSPQKDLAMKVLASVVSPERQADLPKYTSNGPVNLKAFETGKIEPQRVEKLNTSPKNAARQIIENARWQADHLPEIQQRFDQLLR